MSGIKIKNFKSEKEIRSKKIKKKNQNPINKNINRDDFVLKKSKGDGNFTPRIILKREGFAESQHLIY